MGGPRQRVSQGGIEESRSDLRRPSGPHEKAWLQRGNRSLSHKQAETGHVQCNVVSGGAGSDRSGGGAAGGYLILRFDGLRPVVLDLVLGRRLGIPRANG